MVPYQVIGPNAWVRKAAYSWFSAFPNPCYGFDVTMDIDSLIRHSKKADTSFFIDMLTLVMKGLNEVPAMRLRIVNGEIRRYDWINAAFTVMTDLGMFENVNAEWTEDYHLFYERCRKVIEEAKHEPTIKEGYNDDDSMSDYYITCIPWLKYEAMTNPIPAGNPSSCSVPRICWGKYFLEDGRYKVRLNITVSHALVDGKDLSDAFASLQDKFDRAEELLK